MLSLEPRNQKGLYRRAQAHFVLNNYEQAFTDLREAHRLAPNNKPIKKLLDRVRVAITSYNNSQKERLSKFFREQNEKNPFEIASN